MLAAGMPLKALGHASSPVQSAFTVSVAHHGSGSPEPTGTRPFSPQQIPVAQGRPSRRAAGARRAADNGPGNAPGVCAVCGPGQPRRGGCDGRSSIRLGRLRCGCSRRSITTCATSSAVSFHASPGPGGPPPNSVLTDPGIT